MIPQTNDISELEIEKQPSKTYKFNIENNTITGYCDGLEAVKQSIYCILNTERFDYLIYSWNYGIEIKNLIGEPHTYAIPELERVITEALMQDDRIVEVTDFKFETIKNEIIITFKVITTEGETIIEKAVSI